MINELFRIGHHETDVETEEDFFANIRGMVTDDQGNLFILDMGLLQITKYDTNGKLLKQLKFERGNGPGEFNSPKHLGIDFRNRLYVICQENLTLTVLSEDGDYIDSIKLPFLPSALAVGKDKLYITRYWLSGKGNIIHRYSHDLKLEKTFLEKPSNAVLVAMSGEFERIQTTVNGNLIYSFPFAFPYKILEFSAESEILRQASGQKNFTKPPKQEKINGAPVMLMRQGSKGLAILPDGKILNIVQSDDDYYLDFFSPSLEFLARIKAETFGLSALRYMATDNNGNIYLDTFEPIPHVRKYEIDYYKHCV